jgi:hypothetical protein
VEVLSMAESVLNSEPMRDLITAVEEASRSTKEGVKYFVEPAEGTLARTTSKRHHLVFGRRGSGKSSLLRRAQMELTVDRRPISYVDLEAYKGHAYPDVLLSVLISMFEGFSGWLDTVAVNRATMTSFWIRVLFGRAPEKPAHNRRECQNLKAVIDRLVKNLRAQLHAVDGAELERTESALRTEDSQASLGVGVKTGGATVGAGARAKSSQTVGGETREQSKRSKVDFLHRHIIDYQSVFAQMARVSSGDAYLFLDDLYHIRRADQASIIDYFHRIAKSGGLWLKIGTVRHRSSWYRQGDPPVGMKIADDANEINLDLTLEKYPLARNFLRDILTNFSDPLGLKPRTSFLTDDALDRLVLASGGVARDFLTIFRLSVDQARQRGPGTRGGDKVCVEDVNVAAGEHDGAKREEFNAETGDDHQALNQAFERIREFCLETDPRANCFLVQKDQSGTGIDQIKELVDLKLLHLVRGRVTVSGRKGKIFEAYMLDVSQYAGTRKRRGLEEIQFWREDEKLRRASLIYDPDAR